ncbi:DUF4347 domain-containing protein, partial [Methylobacter sp.]
MKFIKTILKNQSGKINSNQSAPASPVSKPALGNQPPYKSRRTMMALEPRIMFDGAAVETAVDTVADATPPVQDAAAIDAAKLAQAAADAAPVAEPTPPVPDVAAVNQDTASLADLVPLPVQADPLPQRTEIVFIESNVTDYQALVDGINPGAEVHVLDASQDGLAQMAQILEGRSGIDAIHIFSHGSEGTVGLGALTLTSQNMQDHTADLAAIGGTLSQNADILLYGCNVAKGSDGAAFIEALSQVTQADVAASTDATGAVIRDGNWVLEKNTGDIEAAVLSYSDNTYSDILQTITVSVLGDGNESTQVGIRDNANNGTISTFDGFTMTTNSGTTGYMQVGAGRIWVGQDYNANQHGTVVTSVAFKRTDGASFAFYGFDKEGLMGGPTTATYQITGYRNNSAVTSTITYDVGTGSNNRSFSSLDWRNVDKVVVTGTDIRGWFGSFNWGATPYNLTLGSSSGASALSAGDIRVVGFNSTAGATDGYALVTLKDIPSGTTLFITDTGIDPATTQLFPYFTTNPVTDGVLVWTTTQIVSAGTVLRASTLANYGTVQGDAPNLSVAGDQIIVYQQASLAGTKTYISAFNSNKATTSTNGWATSVTGPTPTFSGVPNGLNAVAATGGAGDAFGLLASSATFRNAKYTGATTVGTVSELIAAINTVSNWSTTSGVSATAFDLSPLTFTISGAANTVTSATYDAGTNSLVVTGTGMTATTGSANDIDVTKLTLTGQGGATYTLTSSNVEITSATQFTVALNAADQINVEGLLNKNLTSSVDVTTYNIAAAANWDVASTGNADLTGNGITVSNVQKPTISSSTYNASTGVLVVTGTNLVKQSGSANDIDVTKLSFAGQGGSFTLTANTTNVEITDATTFTVTLGSTDKASVNAKLDANGTVSSGSTTYNLAAADDWNGTITPAVSADISDTTGNPITVSGINAAPAITNLNTDSVAWAGVGNTVALDGGTALTIADTENDAANWNGSSLTVQRIVGSTLTPLASDVFSFNATGFTVSGSNLQTGGSTTFGTFTNTNGVLTISFNASATNTLVRDVMRGVLYRNDTPTGDTAIRFFLSDGSLAATADVTVTSDTIYVTNTTDTATIDVSNGVSFSEAIAIAAADNTGSQTLVLNSAFATAGTTLAGNLSIGESLTVNTDAVASGTTLTGSTITIGSGYTLTFTNITGKTTTVASVLAGAGGLSKTGAGTLTLSGTNSRTGATSITGGVLSVATDSNLDGGAATITLDGGTLNVTSSSNTTIDNAVAIGASGGTISVAAATGSQSVTFSGAFTSSAGITLAKTGSGNLQLTGATNSTTMLGGITVTAGGLYFASGATDAMLAAGTITLDGGTLATIGVTGLAIDNAIVLAAGGGTVNISGASLSNTLSGIISGNGTLTKTAGGTLTLSGNNTYTGATTVSLGTLIAGHANALGTTAGSTSVASGATLQLANGITLTENLSINGTGASSAGALTVTSAGTATVSGAVTMTADSTIALATGTNLTVSGVVSGGFALTKGGAGTLTLSGTNTHSGAVTVSAGGLTLQGGSSIGDSSAVMVGSGATLTLNGGNETIGSLAGAGNVVLSYKLTAGGDNTSTTFSGVISSTNTSGLTKTGTGTLTLSGSNTYTGSTTVSAGGLTVSGGSAIADSSAVTVASGATLTLSAGETIGSLAGAGSVTLGANTLIAGSDNTSTAFSGAIGGTGGLTKAGSGALTLSGTNTYTGTTTVSAGTLGVAADANLGAGAVTLAANTILKVTGDTTIDNAVTLSGNATIDNPNGATSLIFSGIFDGAGGLTVTGTAGGILWLSGNNSYSGATVISSGTILANHNNALGTTAAGTTVASGARLGIGNGITLAENLSIAGTGPSNGGAISTI